MSEHKMLMNELTRRMRAIPDIKSAARREGVSQTDFLWNLYHEVECQVKTAFRQQETRRLQTEHMYHQFKWSLREHGKLIS